jgi:hypothetical protein
MIDIIYKYENGSEKKVVIGHDKLGNIIEMEASLFSVIRINNLMYV